MSHDKAVEFGEVLRHAHYLFWQGQTDLVEPWYSTQYSDEAIPADWMASFWAAAAPPELHLPLPNPFISSDFALIKA